MDKKDQIFKLLDSKKEKYPNVVNIWKHFINNQYDILIKSITQCENIFNNIENILDRDMDNSNIIMLYMIKNYMDHEN